MNLVDFIKENINSSEAQEIIFFGGSFNPWHAGHTSCIKLCSEKPPLIIIPDHNPLKEKNSTQFTDLNSIKAQSTKIRDNIFIYDGFYYKGEKNPTVDWISQLSESFPHIKLSLLMGFDSFISLKKWKEHESLLSMLSKIYIADRLNEHQVLKQQIEHLKVFSNLELIFLGSHEFESLSSTQIRKKI